MSGDTRQTSGGNARSKRRLTDIIEKDSRPNSTATDDSTANPKRQRVSRACDSCRSKKDKCDGAQPICSTCASLSRPCTYKANPKKRGLPTGYIRTLEVLWGLVFTKIQGSEEVVRALLRTANMPSHLATMGKEAEGSDTLLSSWKNSIVLKEIERLLTFIEQPDEEQQDRGGRAPGDVDSPQDAEGSSVLSAENLEWQCPDLLGDGRESSLTVGPSLVKTPTATPSTHRQLSTRTTKDSGTQTVPEGNQPGNPDGLLFDQLALQRRPNFPSTAPDRYPQLPSNPWPLLDIYFSYTQCWFPILEKHDILRTAFRHSEDDRRISPSSPGSGDYAALWAALALASAQQASTSATRQLQELPGDQPDPTQLYARAKSLIPEEDGVYEVGHIQALLILALIKLGQQDWVAAWILVGQAVRIAQSLGLKALAIPASSTEESKAAGRSKHVFLGCFILETLVAAQTGQVPSLRKGDLTKVGPVDEDGLEEWHPWEDQTGFRPVESSRAFFHRGPLHALSTFNRLVSLMCILNDLCCWRQTSTSSLSHLEALERQLQLWVAALPKSYRIDLQSLPTKCPSPHIFGLEMMYEGVATVITIQLSAQRGDPNGLNRAADSSMRLLSLLRSYMDAYSISATCPTFGMILTMCMPYAGLKMNNTPLPFETDPGLKSKLQSFSSHLAPIWSTNHTTRPARSEPAATSVPVDMPQRIAYSSSLPPNSLNGAVSTPRPLGMASEVRPGSLSVPDSFFSPAWMRTSASMDDNAALSLPTPPSSLNMAPGMEASNATSQLKESMPNHQPRSSLSRPAKGPMLSELTTPFSAPGAPYQPTYSDPNLPLNSLVDMDGYGSIRRPRIAPDLDALFDELASLDGTDRMDNQPEFMQNLGFVPEAGIPDLYPYTTTQTESFLLPSTQSLTSPGASSVRHESQVTSEANLNAKR
ncbi:hypothetical protein P175DRAFT_0453395 [Aspergillus ochraceoroseus IBT 24754]|uniref:Zn(2)-C6 fungal-type domain-containing protein n=3 Tax=Aspergillus subgen. Nidulantes TaxID=2720870 RepID=A0A0F8X9E3_9EURO|nr:uncharacterized protein P175DRAFT_0453395 [Aspergillus ochraceoroseus IBT 24754]KKK19480.1 hypothetical protein AOCH_007420 [Aspergillus ochraceoroseus]KKK20222.1 hypothetical protein ARAM_004879 [Aspergillus rambellii]PTU22650.1 hypothetical protein P175DRAFT_0453395 [Aspergillus ochraceoroseus IBT 24754]